MVLRWRYLCLVVVLAGCFQQAGESLQPVNSTSTPAAIATTSTNNNAEQAENNSDLSESDAAATPTFPPITVISPRDITPFATVTPLVPDTATPDSIPMTQQLITPISPLMANVGAETTADPNATTNDTGDNLELDGTEEAAVIDSDSQTSSVTTSSTGDACTYTVEPGDNLYRIAIGNNFSLQEMRDANPDLVGEAPVLQPGQVLNLPSCGGDVVSAPEPTDAPTITDPNQTPVGGQSGQSYTVQRGDTLLAIANRYGVTVRELIDANNLTDPNRLDVGQVLIIPA